MILNIDMKMYCDLIGLRRIWKQGALKKKYIAKPPKEPKKKKEETKKKPKMVVSSSKSTEPTSESSSGHSPKQNPQVSSSTTNTVKGMRKPRKGMATPKQRLSKILKINKF